MTENEWKSFSSLKKDRNTRLFVCVQIPEENLFHCRVRYDDSAYASLRGHQELEENVGIYLADNYEKISVPVPHFRGSDPADIIHDFHKVRTKMHNVQLEKNVRLPSFVLTS